MLSLFKTQNHPNRRDSCHQPGQVPRYLATSGLHEETIKVSALSHQKRALLWLNFWRDGGQREAAMVVAVILNEYIPNEYA
jgi:hypothetical protein